MYPPKEKYIFLLFKFIQTIIELPYKILLKQFTE